MIKIQCEMCGSEERLFKAMIEGTELNVCRKCAGFGKILEPVKEKVIDIKKVRKERKVSEVEEIEIVVPDFAKKIRAKREELGLNHKKFAKKISEKESIVHKLETGEFMPSIKMAKKLEQILGIRLIEEYKEEPMKNVVGKTKEITIGDLIKIKEK